MCYKESLRHFGVRNGPRSLFDLHRAKDKLNLGLNDSLGNK